MAVQAYSVLILGSKVYSVTCVNWHDSQAIRVSHSAVHCTGLADWYSMQNSFSTRFTTLLAQARQQAPTVQLATGTEVECVILCKFASTLWHYVCMQSSSCLPKGLMCELWLRTSNAITVMCCDTPELTLTTLLLLLLSCVTLYRCEMWNNKAYYLLLHKILLSWLPQRSECQLWFVVWCEIDDMN
jgi:hypothetical protein